jgi:hypothetical protein
MQVPIRTLHCLNTSDPELLYSHCWQVKTHVFNWDLDIFFIRLCKKLRIGFFGGSIALKFKFTTKDPPKKTNTWYVLLFLGSLVLKLSFNTKDPPQNPIRDTSYFFRGVFSSTKIQILLLILLIKSPQQIRKYIEKWYFVTIIVLTYCEKKLF